MKHVYVHKYLGCLCVRDDSPEVCDEYYSTDNKNDTVPMSQFCFFLALININELLGQAPECWERIGEL